MESLGLRHRILIDVTATLENGFRTGIQRVVVEWSNNLHAIGMGENCFEVLPVVTHRIETGNVQLFKIIPENIRNFRSFNSTPVIKFTVAILGIVRRFNYTRRIYEILFKNRKFARGLFSKMAFRYYLKQNIIDSRVIEFNSTDIYFLADSFWNSPLTIEAIDSAKVHRSKIVLFVHDLIPISNPEFFETNSVDTFKKHFLPVIIEADLVLTASLFVERQVRQLTGYRGPIRKVDLGSSPIAEKTKKETSNSEGTEITAIMIGTLEPRKNYGEILDWYEKSNLLDKILIVGRSGWKNSEIIKKIRRLEKSNKEIKWYRKASDIEVAKFVSEARVAICASYVEGYGLPLREFLNAGIPVVASNIESFQELTQEQKRLVFYFSPGNLESLESAVLGAINEDKVPVNQIELTSWRESADQVLVSLKRSNLLDCPSQN